jgi:broad specificity phosphatase PhoE
MSLFVIRPGETDYDLQDRVQGSLNLPLNERGVMQVDEIIRRIRESDVDVIYASPTEPALSTARRIAQALEKPLKVIDSLTNVDLGLWQGRSIEEIRTKQPRVYRKWEDAPESVCPPQGESCEEAYERVAKALKKPMKRGGTFAVVASEPLATLVTSVLRQERPHLPGPACRCSDQCRVEILNGEQNLPGTDRQADCHAEGHGYHAPL